MDSADYRTTSCYPDGLAPTRRAFLASLATAAAAAGTSCSFDTETEMSSPGVTQLPSIPPGGFPIGSVQLNFNENPLGPSPRAIEAILDSGLVKANRYTYIDPLIEAIGRHIGMPAENVLVGCGSTEFLQFAPWAFLQDRGSMVVSDPTYGWTAGVAETMGRRVIRVPVDTQGVVDSQRMREAIRRGTRVVYLVNPNNPTGGSIPHEEVVSLVEALPSNAILMVDEAYYEFLPEAGRTLDLVRQGAPVLVLRTFSKVYGLAGLRLGFAIGPMSVLTQLRKVWWEDFGINTAAQIAGPAALGDQEHVRRYIELVDSGLIQLRSGLSDFGFAPFPHRAPFMMVDLGRTTDAIHRALYERNIFVQPGSKWGMPNFLRVSVGTAEDNAAFLNALQEMTV